MWFSASPSAAVIYSFSISALFVASLYVWRAQALMDRDHPNVIQRRIFSVAVVSAIAPLLLYFLFASTVHTAPTLFSPSLSVLIQAPSGPSFFAWMGIYSPTQPIQGFIAALFLPNFLVCLLFLGPLICSYLETYLRILSNSSSDFSIVTCLWSHIYSCAEELATDFHRFSWQTMRNLVFAPVFEEFVFRSCMCCILLSSGFSFSTIIILSPTLFSVAHFHHLMNLVRSRGYPWNVAIKSVLFQLFYTGIFGLLASYIYVRTGQLTAVILVHALCNYFGFPNLNFLVDRDHFCHQYRKQILACYLLGIILFWTCLRPLTQPALYGAFFHSYSEHVQQNAAAQKTIEQMTAAAFQQHTPPS